MPGVGSVTSLSELEHKDSAHTYDPSTDSLEALRDFLTPSGLAAGLYYSGTVDSIPGADQFIITSLAGLGDGKFIGPLGSPYFIFVFRDAGGLGAAPQGEMVSITAYDSATGAFTHRALTAALVAGDEVLILNPRLAEIGIVQGLQYYGKVTAVPGADQFTVPLLAGLGAGKFVGTWPYWAYVLRDSAGLGGVPQGELQPVIDYDTATGDFTTLPFTAAVAVDDEILLMNPMIANLLTVMASLLVPAADAVANAYERDVIGAKPDTALYAATATASLMRYIKALLATKVIATGTLTTDSTTVPADTSRTEGNDYFKGCTIMPLTGAAAFQPRPIRQFTTGTDVFTLDEPFTVAPGLVAYVILAAEYPVQRLIDIFDDTNAMLVLTETGGTLTATGAEDTLYINNAPAGEYEPRALFIDLDEMLAGDITIIRVYYRIITGGGLQLYDYQAYNGADGSLTNGRKLISVGLLPNRYGVQVTLEQTAGGAMRDYDWDVHMEI